MPQVIAQNVEALRDRKYDRLPNVTARNRALAKDADTVLSQVQRVIAGDTAIRVDIVEAISQALGVRPQDLLTPYFASTTEGLSESVAPPRDTAELHRR